jgi:hypothetical protein
MINKKYIRYFYLLIFFCEGLLAQNLYLKDNVANDLFNPNYSNDKKYQFFNLVDLYQLNQNPASLLLSNRKTDLFISYNYNLEKGDFRRIFDEEKKTVNKPVIDITYRIDTNQAVHGNISFYENYSYDRSYAENRFPYRGDPYILADVNPGDFKLDMLNIETEYSRRIFNKIILGTQISYSIGEGLKKYFPKPTSMYRDLGLRLGLNYELNDDNEFGIFGEYFNFYEEIIFGDNTRNPVLLKFRGLDYPVIFAGLSSVTRIYRNDGWGAGVEYQGSLTEKFDLLASARIFTDLENVTDGITFPKAQGRWRENQYEIKVIGNYKDQSFSAKAGLLCEINEQASARPKIDEAMMKRNSYLFSPFVGYHYQFSPTFSSYILYQPYFSKIEVQDFINTIKYSVPSVSHSLELGANFRSSEYVEVSLIYNLLGHSPTYEKIEVSDPSSSFFTYFEPDIKYEQTKFTNHKITGKLVYHFGILGDFGFVIQDSHLTANNDKYRDYINFSAFINLFIF